MSARDYDCLEPGMGAKRLEHMSNVIPHRLFVSELESRRTLVGQIRPIQPDLRVLYISGFDEELPVGPVGAQTLRTPSSLDKLRAAIAARLDRSESAG